MKYLKLFEGYQTESEVAEICRKYNIENWTLNSDGLVDVDGFVNFSGVGLTKLPLKFGHVTDYFRCNNNNLRNLEGAPHTVDGYFNCSKNKLTSLVGAPKFVRANFNCERNQLTSLKGAPNTVGGYFDCQSNVLTSLEGAPNTVGKHLDCRFNNIHSFEGLVNISGDFYCDYNPVARIWDMINYNLPGATRYNYKWDSEKMEFFNDLDIIRGEEIAIERLNFFLEEIGLDPVEYVEGYKNIY